MKINVTTYYKNIYKQAYLMVNKEPRRLVCLIRYDGKRHTMSYAKYIYTSHYCCDIPKGYEVDHINNDKMDDRIENLQLLSSSDNRRKSHSKTEMILLKCPICHKQFLFEKRNLSTHPQPCCSRKCGGKKSYLTKINNISNNNKGEKNNDERKRKIR